ncbi:MAG: flagellar basal-body rod protein FlgG [Burkholderiales bacterium]|nr:flagellar basal-body rod protein FlgG [Burkholderiales bacterium]
MNDALYIAATGMQTQQLAVDTISNNLANAQTPGFKSGHVNFQELMYRDVAAHGAHATAPAGADDTPAAALAQGSGVGVASMFKDFSAGTVATNGTAMNLAIKGDGFLEVQSADGSTAYWRGGLLQVNADGWLATAQGQVLKPQIRVDAKAGDLVVGTDGKVSIRKAGAADVEVGQLSLQVFANAAGLKAMGDALYQATPSSGDASPVRATDAGAGQLVQGGIEQSNVNLVDEMVNLMMAQRAYEMNVKVIQAADEMVGMSNNLRK